MLWSYVVHPHLSRQLAQEGYTERRKREREARMVDIKAVIAEGELSKKAGASFNIFSTCST